MKNPAKVVLELNMEYGLLSVLGDLFVTFLCFFLVLPPVPLMFSANR